MTILKYKKRELPGQLPHHQGAFVINIAKFIVKKQGLFLKLM
jgi:hypothetical protein